MRSSMNDLLKRGYVTVEEILALSPLSQEHLIEKLHSQDSVTRSAAAGNLNSTDEISILELLKQLTVEKCLYTKIAICESLQKGDSRTAARMIAYLGVIGNNQYHSLPDKVSAKKSFPLPRDIVARTLGNMNIVVFPVLESVLLSNDPVKISEGLDAIGYMVFYHQSLATSENLRHILTLLHCYSDLNLILWKTLLCLSAFPLAESREALLQFSDRNDILGMEARRSLCLIER